MPRGNKTGPWGQGSRTGRSLGFCSDYSSPGYTKGYGRGRGGGFGRGQGWRGGGWSQGGGLGRGHYFYPMKWPTSAYSPVTQINPEDEVQFLEDSLKGLENEMEAIKKRLEELSKKDEF
ncbi:MAG: DUF5320 domain-containing protein [Candidatus Hodarchaeales archaeon]|jgi:hypothetical protein